MVALFAGISVYSKRPELFYLVFGMMIAYGALVEFFQMILEEVEEKFNKFKLPADNQKDNESLKT